MLYQLSYPAAEIFRAKDFGGIRIIPARHHFATVRAPMFVITGPQNQKELVVLSDANGSICRRIVRTGSLYVVHFKRIKPCFCERIGAFQFGFTVKYVLTHFGPLRFEVIAALSRWLACDSLLPHDSILLATR